MTEYANDKDQKWEELKSKWSSSMEEKIQIIPKPILNEKQIESESLSDIINSLQNQLQEKNVTLKEIKSNDLLADLKEKKQQLDNDVNSKKQHIKELKSKQQILQKE